MNRKTKARFSALIAAIGIVGLALPARAGGIIIYELTMLGAILTSLMFLLIGAHLPNWRPHLTDPEIWAGKILVGVTDPPASSDAMIERTFKQAGASVIKRYPAAA